MTTARNVGKLFSVIFSNRSFMKSGIFIQEVSGSIIMERVTTKTGIRTAKTRKGTLPRLDEGLGKGDLPETSAV
jgi:hypothetical protein